MSRDEQIDVAVDALSGILPGFACRDVDGRALVHFAGRERGVSVDLREMAARVVDALAVAV